MRDEITKFSDAKNEFDKLYVSKDSIEGFLPVDTELAKECKIKNTKNEPNE